MTLGFNNNTQGKTVRAQRPIGMGASFALKAPKPVAAAVIKTAVPLGDGVLQRDAFQEQVYVTSQVSDCATPPGSPNGVGAEVTPRTAYSTAPDTETMHTLDELCATPTKQDQYKDAKPCCDHNDWDNVRVNKKVMTLRCRVCQKQFRLHVNEVWNNRKCDEFTTQGSCHEHCPKLHINYRKQNLETRFKNHGASVLNHVRIGRAQADVQQKVDGLKATIESSPESSPGPTPPSSPYFTHDPYTWGDVLPPSFSV
eukprot:TRINITY_DN8586_c1_g1_i1.p1 TRINITY_DN8586_c1_g1~~TRINITY_DN8586_c1_g1_i1.p1  ORF type:complete len:255 (+),score=42.38 TRINITY_DN8586_c1_g1_i1:50-814(+)